MGKKILLIEDDQSLHELYSEILKEEGYEIIDAYDGEEAYQHIKDQEYDLILLDYKIPKLNGIELLKKIRAESPLLKLGAILILTNAGEDSLVADAISLGAKGYLVKADYTPDAIVKEIKKYIS